MVFWGRGGYIGRMIELTVVVPGTKGENSGGNEVGHRVPAFSDEAREVIEKAGVKIEGRRGRLCRLWRGMVWRWICFQMGERFWAR